MFFLTPEDVKDTAFLNFDYTNPDRDDDQWLYLPALKKVKRIPTSDKTLHLLWGVTSHITI